MKKMLIILLLAAALHLQGAPLLVIAKTANIAWDPVTKLADGSALPAGGTISYDVVVQPTGGGTTTVLATVSTTQATVNFPAPWSLYDVGVRAVLTYQGNNILSAVAWGSVAGTPSPFSFLSGQAPGTTSNLRLQ
ncbi:MAG: hypothetical protein LAO04_21610 [Acidobacteriia bacterium]|nr:hypothetical protein [Terriglobia bacterium]